MRAERPTDRGLSPRRTGRGQAGTTLPELLITLVVFTIIMLVVIVMWQQSQQAYFHGATAAELQQNARVALEQMTREIRQAGYDPCWYCNPCNSAFDASVHPGCATVAPGVLPVQTFTATSIWVRADRNGNGDVTPGVGNPDENICFRLAGDQILRKTTGVDCTSGGVELARNINALTLTYLKANGTAATVWSDIRIVRISISAQEMFMGAPVTVTLRSDVRLRDR